MYPKQLCIPIVLLAMSLAPMAEAHIDLNYPASRNGNQKSGPCEGKDRTEGGISTLRSGSTLTIQIKETIPHPGHMRVLFDSDTTDGEDFSDPVACDEFRAVDGITVLGDNILPASGPEGSSCYDAHLPSVRTAAVQDLSFSVTLPDIECENCAIQVVQVMTDIGKQTNGQWNPAAGAGLYFRCANVRLSRTEPVTEPGMPPVENPGPANDGPDAGPQAGGDADAGTTTTGDNPTLSSGGCQSTGNSGGLWLLLLGALWIRRRAR